MAASEREEPQDLDSVLLLLTEPITENDYSLATVGFDPILATLHPSFEGIDIEVIVDEVKVILDAAEGGHIRAQTLVSLSDVMAEENIADYDVLASDDEPFDPDASLDKIEEILRANKEHLSQDTIDKLDL